MLDELKKAASAYYDGQISDMEFYQKTVDIIYSCARHQSREDTIKLAKMFGAE